MKSCDPQTMGLKCDLAVAAQNFVCFEVGPGPKFDKANALCEKFCDTDTFPEKCFICTAWYQLNQKRTSESTSEHIFNHRNNF